MIPDWYQTITEVAIGLAGFSGLAVALRRDAGPLTTVQKFRMSVLFGMAFGALFMSLAPFVLTELGVASDMLWKYASAAMSAWSACFIYLWVVRSFRVAKKAPEIFTPRAFTMMSVGHVAILCMQIAVVFDWANINPPGAFGAGLIWYLIHGSQQFVRMLFIQPRDQNVE